MGTVFSDQPYQGQYSSFKAVVRRVLGRQILTLRELRQYWRDGYLVIDPAIPGDVLDGVVAELADQFTPAPSLANAYRDHVRFQDAWKINANARQIALAPRVLNILRELYGRLPLPFQTINFRVGTQQRVHSDTIHFNAMPAGYMCGVWVALEDIDMDNGPLVFYPGSHRLPEYTLADVGTAPGIANYVRYEDYIAEVVRRHNLKPKYGLLKKGQALIWAANLLHGGAPQQDPARSRHSQVTHVFFEGCRYYTPLFSHPGQIVWRTPEWIQ